MDYMKLPWAGGEHNAAYARSKTSRVGASPTAHVPVTTYAAWMGAHTIPKDELRPCLQAANPIKADVGKDFFSDTKVILSAVHALLQLPPHDPQTKRPRPEPHHTNTPIAPSVDSSTSLLQDPLFDDRSQLCGAPPRTRRLRVIPRLARSYRSPPRPCAPPATAVPRSRRRLGVGHILPGRRVALAEGRRHPRRSACKFPVVVWRDKCKGDTRGTKECAITIYAGVSYSQDQTETESGGLVPGKVYLYNSCFLAGRLLPSGCVRKYRVGIEDKVHTLAFHVPLASQKGRMRAISAGK